jgi:hypothetical protein
MTLIGFGRALAGVLKTARGVNLTPNYVYSLLPVSAE